MYEIILRNYKCTYHIGKKKELYECNFETI